MRSIAVTYAYQHTTSVVGQAELLRIREAMARRGHDGNGLAIH